MNAKDRQIIFDKFGGKCAYSGTPLESDWQVDHLIPVVRNWWSGDMVFKKNDIMSNLIPCQKLINHYKHSYDLETFRTWLLGGLHTRLKKVPKNPRTTKGAARKKYILKVAGYFGITEDKPFNGKFYFETLY
jgi:5-methylcytosine-specific restriction endonuclease McrA